MFQNTLQRKFIEDDYVGQAFTAQRSDETLRKNLWKSVLTLADT